MEKTYSYNPDYNVPFWDLVPEITDECDIKYDFMYTPTPGDQTFHDLSVLFGVPGSFWRNAWKSQENYIRNNNAEVLNAD